MKEVRHFLYEAALIQLRLFSLTHRRIRGDLIVMFKITHGLLEFPMASTYTHPTREGLRGHAYKFHQQRCCTRRRRFAYTIRPVPFWNKLSAEIVNASSVKSFKILPGTHCQSLFPKIPIQLKSNHNPLPQHISAHVENSHPNDPSHITHPPTWLYIIVFTAS